MLSYLSRFAALGSRASVCTRKCNLPITKMTKSTWTECNSQGGKAKANTATMLALQYDPIQKKLSLTNTSQPSAPEKREVVVKIAYSGVCGTDLHIVEGSFPCSESPIILGHEFCGEVLSAGSAVTHVKPGDRVVVDPESGCNTCNYCHSGKYHYCKTGALNSAVGIYRNGGWAQYCKVPADQVHKLPDNIPLEQAVLTEPLSCIAHGWDIASPLLVGSQILVLGAGIIGNLWASILHLQGHRNVTVSEPQEGRRKLVQKLETGFDVISPDELRARKSKDPDWGVDLVIDCSGYAPAMEEAIPLINPGGKLCIFGVSSPDAKMNVSPYLVFKNELSIIGININPFSFPKALHWVTAMGSRYLSYEKLGIKTFSLSEYEEALQCLKKGTIAKAVFKIEHK